MHFAEGDLVRLIEEVLRARFGGHPTDYQLASVEIMMAGHWRDARALRVVRREPHATGAPKILPLHIIKDR